MIWVFAPDAYSNTGSFVLLSPLPISRCAMQWLTGMSGLLYVPAKYRAVNAPMARHGPSPGPWEKAIASTSFIVIFAFVSACLRMVAAFSAWWLLASTGCIPPFFVVYAALSFASIS